MRLLNALMQMSPTPVAGADAQPSCRDRHLPAAACLLLSARCHRVVNMIARKLPPFQAHNGMKMNQQWARLQPVGLLASGCA